MDLGWRFEMTMRLIFGNKAYQIAGTESQQSERRRWLKKALRQLTRTAIHVDTTPRHLQMLVGELAAIETSLESRDQPHWETIYRLMNLSARLLGFDYVAGALCHTPVFYQTAPQHYTSIDCEGGDALQDYYDRKNIVVVKRRLVSDLRKQGLDEFQISLALNITEYEVKKLRRESKPNRTK